MTSRRAMRQHAVDAAAARRAYAALARAPLSPGELAAFDAPIRLADVATWRADAALCHAVAQAEADGLLCSPGVGPWWVLTARGRAAVAAGRRAAS